MSSKVLGLVLAAFAALQFLSASADLANLTSPQVTVWLQLIGGAAQVFLAVYTGRVVLTPADPSHPDNLSSNQLRKLASKAATSENNS